jgi:hypothetical protein
MMRFAAAFVLIGCLLPVLGRSAELNLAAVNCDKYENEILTAAGADAIDTVMWLFGYSVARSGEHVMYGDALTSFGFALDAQCKNNPSMALLQALSAVRPERDKPMDLATLNCATWETRHGESSRTDPESANTLMMWLFGYSVGQSGSHLFDPTGVKHFASVLQTRCTQHPDDSLFDALAAAGGPVKR